MAGLIAGNADYLVHYISLRLRQAARGHTGHSEAIQVLGAVMSHGEEGVCGMVRVTVSQLLFSLDPGQLDPASLWEGLRTLSHSCRRWLASREQTGSVVSEGVAKREVADAECVVSEGVADAGGVVSEGGKRGGEVTSEAEDGEKRDVGIRAIADFFLHYHKEKEEEGEAQGGEVQGEGAQAEDEDYSGNRTLSAAEQITVDIMQRCAHHMAHHAPRVRLIVMETLQHCMVALSHDKVRGCGMYPFSNISM